MKTTDAGPPGMRLIDAKLRLAKLGGLAHFIAERREPGDKWLPYEAIAAELKTLTRESVTRAGVEKWAKEVLGIPKTERNGTDEERAAYRAAVDQYLKVRR